MPSPIQQKRVVLALGNHYIESIHRGVADFAGQNHWHLTNVFGEAPGLIQKRSCHGILASLMSNDPLSEAIIKRRLPSVDLGVVRNKLKMPHITGDNVQMGREAARHFLDRGFQNFIWYSEHNHTMAEHRRDGYQAKLREHGFDCLELILPNTFSDEQPSWQTQQLWIQKAIRSLPQPCAVYAYNDLQAVSLIDACVATGICVPDEVAVLGTDNHPLVCPTAAVPLSSINHDLEELGRRAAQELDAIMNGAVMERKIIEIPHHGITVRHSTDVFAINDPYVVKALHFIYGNFHHSIGVEDVVKASELSRRQLEYRFKEHLDQSILGKLNGLRLQKTCRLLRETEMSIADIAAISGFNTPEYLHRVFHKQIGTTPRAYRFNVISE